MIFDSFDKRKGVFFFFYQNGFILKKILDNFLWF